MKQTFQRRFCSAFLILILYVITLFSGCNFPSGSENITPSVTQTPGIGSGTLSPEGNYLIIPLTAGEVSPISACSYDLLHTVCTIQIYDSTDYNILNECFAVIDKYEKLFSRTLESSEVYTINQASASSTNPQTTFTVSDELKDILEFSLSYGVLSEGALDISIAPLSSLWDFSDLEHKTTPPSAEAIAAAKNLVDYRDISLNGNTLTFAKPGMQLELGAVAKGYIADRVKDFLLSKGVTSALINLGGNILLVGEKPDGSAFNVGIQKPFEDRDAVVVAISELKDCSMVSSGIYERYFYDETGNFYHHILNAETGYPCNTDLLQVTIISKDSATGDALSTACFALGLEKGMALIDSLTDIHAVFITSDGKLHFSKNFLETIPTRTE
ncbi:MAG: FAD:protein FMN transferase [Lachnospiraceae bacterium]|nr:FAD:protein FMN transferase [Lachnospiraceae bacterium]